MSDDKYFVVAEEYACDGVYIDQLLMEGSEEDCCNRAFSINFGGGEYEYRNARVFSEEEYEKEFGSGNMMKQPYTLHLKDYHEFSWVVAALNFFVKHHGEYGSPLGDCYYDDKQAEEMLDRVREEFLEYAWDKIYKEKDEDGEYFCEFEDNLMEGLDPSDWMVRYYDKEKCKERIKEWNLCNTTMEANCTKIAMGLDDIHIEQCLHDLNLYGTACDRVLTKDELKKVFSHSNAEYKKWFRTCEGQEWINSDD